MTLKGFLSKKSDKQKVGQAAEEATKRFLENQGLTFLEKNVHSRFGEIDLIFTSGETLIFVEVRFRQRNDFGNTLETVNYNKQQKIIKAAEYYLHKNNLSEAVSCRFDVVGVEPKKNSTTTDRNKLNYDFQWIKNAFY